MSVLGSFSTEVADPAAPPTSASPRKLTSGPNEKLIAVGPATEVEHAHSIIPSARASRIAPRRDKRPRLIARLILFL